MHRTRFRFYFGRRQETTSRPLEERDLARQLGPRYERYRDRVPMLLPLLLPPRRRVEQDA